MNYTSLQQAILDDTHKSQYIGAPVQRFVAQGEALISAYLESFNFLAQLTDANRVSAGSSNYNLPAGLVNLRYVRINGYPLDKVDETTIFLYQTSSQPRLYAQRASQIIIAGTPGTGIVIDIDYMGMPDALAITPSNTLLDAYPQLYIDAAAFYIHRRAESFDTATSCLDSLKSLCTELNRKSKKLLGGAQAAPAYNTQFRSSY
jgi:hypothetical protein